MSLLIATGVVTFSFLLTLVIAFPARNAREVAPPVKCEVRQLQENRETTKTHSVLGHCIEIHNSGVPTSLQIMCDDSPSATHSLHGFSTASCKDDDVIISKPLPLTRNVGNQRVIETINERTPICSFRLGDEPFPQFPVKVTFQGTQSPHVTIVNDKRCVTNHFCGEGADVVPKHAMSVDIHEESDGTVANNYVELFSDDSCEQRIEYGPGNFKVYSGADLVSLTNPNSKTVQAIRLTL